MSRREYSHQPLVIRVFDVGHGDSILVEFPDQTHIGIVDCNIKESGRKRSRSEHSKAHEPKALSHLKTMLDHGGNLVVSFICLSHFHDDHYFGLGRLIKGLMTEGVKIGEFWDPGVSVRKSAAQQKRKDGSFKGQKKSLTELRELYEAKRLSQANGMHYEPIVSHRRRLKTVAGVGIDILAPDSSHWEDYSRFLAAPDKDVYSGEYKEHTDEHLVCSAIMLRYGKAKVILGADLTCRGWTKVLANWGVKYLKCHAVKISHHGSAEGNSVREDGTDVFLWSKIGIANLTISAISGGYRMKLPHSGTLAGLITRGIRTYCTGNFLRSLKKDPIWKRGLSKAICQHIESSTKPVIEHTETYHGDIEIKVHDDGRVVVDTEHKIPPL